MNYIKENLQEFELGGILQAHSDGFLGEGIFMMEWESCNPELSFYHGKVRDPFNYGSDKVKNTHGGGVVDVKHQGAPMSIIYIAPSSQNSNGTGKFFELTVPFTM